MMTACACIGPEYGEPHCYCEMKRKGLPLNREARDADAKQFKEALNHWLKSNVNAVNCNEQEK
jgi:hypothetical protein